MGEGEGEGFELWRGRWSALGRCAELKQRCTAALAHSPMSTPSNCALTAAVRSRLTAARRDPNRGTHIIDAQPLHQPKDTRRKRPHRQDCSDTKGLGSVYGRIEAIILGGLGFGVAAVLV